MQMRKFVYAATTAGLFFSGSLLAGVAKDLPIPSSTPGADEIANQVYFVNHYLFLKELRNNQQQQRP